MKQAQVQLIARSDLNLLQWDAAIQRAPYGLSWWLDAVTQGNWFGLVIDDYRVVMPLPLNRSLGPLKLINGAPFTQHQGPFGNLRDGDLDLLLNNIPKYWYIRKLAIYPPWPTSKVLHNWTSASRTNLELNLTPDYPTIARGYRGNLRRKLRDFPVTTLAEWPLNDFLAFYQKNVGAKSQLSNTNLSVLRKLTENIIFHKAGHCYHLSNDKGETIAALLLVRHGNRIFNLLAASNPEGFKLHGMTRLLDGIIQAHCGSNIVLDFEGSDLPGVALFFRGFGAKPVNYLGIQRKW